jgi:hypothetical protein
VVGRLLKVNCATCLPSLVVLAAIQGPVSASVENSILLIVTSVSPSLLKNTLFWTFPAPRVVLKETVIGVILKRAAAELD